MSIDERDVRACCELGDREYLGARMWKLANDVAPTGCDDSDGESRLDNSSLSRAIREALRMTAPLARVTRIAVRAEQIRHGVIANNTFPPTAWWFDIDPGAAGVAADLDTAIWECLSVVRLSPSLRGIARSPFDDQRFSFEALNATPDPTAWAADLTRCAQQWLGADAIVDEAYELIRQPRALGHPLFSVDESDDFVIWATWRAEAPRRHLQLHVQLPAYEAPVVTVTVRDNDGAA